MSAAVAAMDRESQIWLNIATHLGRAIADFEEFNRIADERADEFCETFAGYLERAFEETRAGFEGCLMEFIRSGGGRLDFNDAAKIMSERKARQRAELGPNYVEKARAS